MKNITINEVEIQIPTSWLDVTFEKFQGFNEITKLQPTSEEVDEMFAESTDELRVLELSLLNINQNTKLACYWTGLSEEEISVCGLDEIEEILNSVSFLNEPYNPIALDKFTFKNDVYYLPEPGMATENFGTFIEAEQIELHNKKLETGDLTVLTKQVAILCKQKGDKRGLVNDALIDKRAEEFKELDMATIWDVGFFLTIHENSLMKLFLTSAHQAETQKLKLHLKEQSQDMDG
tara:strand:- start:7879 stop:8583 length:705 start_codon:yes stop_codon:yes gene_type:complete